VTFFDDGVRTAKEFKADLIEMLKNPGPRKKKEDRWVSLFHWYSRSFVPVKSEGDKKTKRRDNHDEESEYGVQLQMLEELWELAKKRQVLSATIMHILMFFHDEDVFDDEGIMEWVNHIDKKGSEEDKAIRNKCNKFIEWVQESSDEDEEDDDED
jgi:hypothetical protein